MIKASFILLVIIPLFIALLSLLKDWIRLQTDIKMFKEKYGHKPKLK